MASFQQVRSLNVVKKLLLLKKGRARVRVASANRMVRTVQLEFKFEDFFTVKYRIQLNIEVQYSRGGDKIDSQIRSRNRIIYSRYGNIMNILLFCYEKTRIQPGGVGDY